LKHETPCDAPCVLRIDLTHLDQKPKRVGLKRSSANENV